MNKNKSDISLEDSYTIFKEIERTNISSQRDLAHRMGYSLGKINYLLKALTDKGFVKLENFSNSNSKIAYRYILTPKGITEKYRVTRDFLKRKEVEFIRMQVEIEELRREVKES